MPGDVQHERGEILPVEHLVAEGVAAEPRARLEEPFGEDRALGQRRRQDRGNIGRRLLQFALDRVGFRGLIDGAGI